MLGLRHVQGDCPTAPSVRVAARVGSAVGAPQPVVIHGCYCAGELAISISQRAFPRGAPQRMARLPASQATTLGSQQWNLIPIWNLIFILNLNITQGFYNLKIWNSLESLASSALGIPGHRRASALATASPSAAITAMALDAPTNAFTHVPRTCLRLQVDM